MPESIIVIARVRREFGSGEAAIGLLREALQSLGEVRIVAHIPAAREAREGGGREAWENPLDEFFRIELSTTQHAKTALSILGRTPGVSNAYQEPRYSLPTLVATPDYVSSQLYLGPALDGIDARYAWHKGVKGAGVALADIEEGWVLNHEDFDASRIALRHGEISPDPASIQHGTACVGVAFARLNSRGITGIARGVNAVHCCSRIGQDNSPALAIVRATDLLSPGDVLLIEVQADGPDGGKQIPVEFFEADFLATQRATSQGITVVASAGNGGTSLDDPIYGGAFNRSAQDSGAILVGAAGAPIPGSPLARCRLPLSNWGSRVDVQGYGEWVCTTGYGDLFGRALGLPETRWYTAGFNGTSSASAIVWGACALLQSFAKKKLHRHLAPDEIRSLLVNTGSAQRDHQDSPVQNHIGPLPNLRCAIEQLSPRANSRQRRSLHQVPR